MRRFILILTSFLFFNSLASAELINWVVGEVGGDYVTVRDVQINTVLESILYPSSEGIKKEPLNIGFASTALTQQTTSLLLEKVVDKEARQFEVGKLSEEDIEKKMQEIARNVLGWAYWQDLQVRPEELRIFISQKLRAKSFLRFKTDATSVPVTDDEALVYYESNRKKFGQLTYESLKDNIKNYLMRQNRDQRLRDWFEVLKRKYSIRNYQMEGIQKK